MLRHLGLAGAFALAMALFSPAYAQQAQGGFCGSVTWQGQSPIPVWIALRRNNTWATAEDGAMAAMGQGTFTQSGATLTMTGGETTRYTVIATAVEDRIVGEVSASDGTRGIISVTQMRGTGSGLRSSPVPANFVIPSAERALAGDMEGVLEAFSWNWTPQGADYWGAVYDSGRLPDHAAAAIRDWVRRAQAGERPVCDAQ